MLNAAWRESTDGSGPFTKEEAHALENILRGFLAFRILSSPLE
jgi:hypothetical protein